MSDTGTGMDDATKAKVFEPFFTTKEAGKGTGLGLATVYGIVKQSEGFIWLYSEPGHGATFKIYLPRVDAPVEPPARAPELIGSVAGTETVLLAEDDTLLRPLARDLLTKLGYRVLEPRDSSEALACARAHAGEIHLLVTDVVMPGGGGFQLGQTLVSERPELKVLYMSGYTDEAVVRHGLLERGLNYLQKPFTPAVLARRVRDMLDA
jgi:CheY-like chemotaxis protein